MTDIPETLTLSLAHVADLNVDLSPPMQMGRGRLAERRIIPIVGGTVKGPRLNGTILNLGADWLSESDEGLAILDTRYAIETDDGALVEVINQGYRHGSPEVLAALRAGEIVPPEQYYMRTHARLESGDPRYAWVNATIFVSAGARLTNAVRISLYALQ